MRTVARSAVAIGLLAPFFVSGARPANALGLSPDVPVVLGSNNQLVSGNGVAIESPSNAVALETLGTLPAASDVSGYHQILPSGDRLLCFDTVVELPGPLTVQAGDVVRHGTTYTIEFAAAGNGVPAGTYCDAVALDSSGKLLLSFDVTVALPGGVVADDEDIVRLDGPSTWSVAFDGSAATVPAALDVDAAEQLPNLRLLLSFDGSGEIGGIDFDDEDVLEYDPVGSTWSLAYDGDGHDPDWAAADLDALPEPGLTLGLALGGCALGALRRQTAREVVRGSR